jgi:nucleotide-binding universal stress UspA family protein
MKGMKRILIALDYDPTAQKVAETGFALAKTMSAELILLHVMAAPVYYSAEAYSPIMGFGGYFGTDFLQPNVAEELRTASLEYLEKTKKHLGDSTIQTEIRTGETAESILATAIELKADIIVIGSHSKKWLDKILMGSITEKVLNDSTIPLFIVPTKKENNLQGISF